MAQRNLKTWGEAHTCDTCRRLTPPVVELATHGCTDSVEVRPGEFEETTKERHGCSTHRVAPVVSYLNGDVKPLSEVLSCQ